MLRSKRRLNKAFFERKFSSKWNQLDSRLFSFKFGKFSPDETRFACVVSKKEANLAVKRNKIRRQFYGILSEIYPRVRPGFCGIFFLKKEGVVADSLVLRREIENFLKKAAILD